MRYLLASLMLALNIGIAGAVPFDFTPPRLEFDGVLTADYKIPRLPQWGTERILSGIGWELGTVSRGDGTVMQGGFTVIHPKPGIPFSWRHCYVLAAFDIMPEGRMLLTVRDPEYYWADYDHHSGVVDPLELVWYDDDWQELSRILIDDRLVNHPDAIRLSPDQKLLLMICRPVNAEGDPSVEGHHLIAYRLRDGISKEVLLPEAVQGLAPPPWRPVRMQFGAEDELQVQAGEQLRIYQIKWR